MLELFHIDGVVPILPTPFRSDDEIDFESVGPLIRFARAAGACAVCLPAYASEFYKLDDGERLALVRAAVEHADGNLPVIAQANSPSLKHVIASARQALDAGAAAVCTAVPRLFAVGEPALYDYFDRLLGEIRAPYVIQDFNPGGSSLSVDFIARLHRAHPHFCYVKLEEPMLAMRIGAIHEATSGGVGVLEGWGGMYTLDLGPAGVAGVVPGLALTDLLRRVFELARAGRREEAAPVFEGILPQILFSLQNMELFHHAEKRLLVARGVLREAHVRRLAMHVSDHDAAYIDFLNGRVLALLQHLGLPRNPAHHATV